MADGQDAAVVVGRIAGLHGVKGWVKVFSETRPRENILGYGTWLLDLHGRQVPVTVAEGRLQGKGVVVARLEGRGDRDQARELVGCPISVYRSQLDEPDPDEVYWVDLIGCRVLNDDGEDLGQVERLFETGANDVMVVHGQRETLIPFVGGEVIRDIDLENRVIRVAWLEPE